MHFIHTSLVVEKPFTSMHDFTLEEYFDAKEEAHYGREIREKYRELKNLVKEYLEYPSSDGSIKRPALRKKLAELTK